MIGDYKITHFTLLCWLIISGCDQNDPFGPWEFRQAGSDLWYSANIPGTVHTDLMANGLISDPFIGLNELDVQWIENEDWEYRTTLHASTKLMQHDHVDLNFEGLDTYADVYINDSLVISADNMHISWSADIKKFLRTGKNILRVYFHSPVQIGQQKLNEHPYLVPTSNEPKPVGQQTSVFTRKAQYHYGWDWSPRLVTSGIWRNISLQGWDKGKIDKVEITPVPYNADSAEVSFTIHGMIEKESNFHIEIDIFDAEYEERSHLKEFVMVGEQKEFHSVTSFTVSNPQLWWPNGIGEQHQYEYTVRLMVNNLEKDIFSGKFSITDIKLVHEPDEDGSSFKLVVNDKPIFIKGANYIPPDFFNPRARDKYNRVVQDAVDANMNMLRVWGGGIYENEEFYNLCDEKGILVWQDFMFACCMVPGNEFYKNILIEADQAYGRLSQHPSVAMWCGNNESWTGWQEWGWQDAYDLHDIDSTHIMDTYNFLFNSSFYKYPNYWPSSPSSGINQIQNKYSGDQHEWGVWFGQLPFDHYEKNAGRFISEYGIQSLPEMSTIKKMDPSIQNWSLETEALQFRQRSKMPWIADGFDGFDMMDYYMEMYFPEPEGLEEIIYISQLTQALALQTAAEAHRRKKPYTMGTLFWQIDDVWPTVSWSTVDYYGNWKAAHFTIQETYKNTIICGTDDGDQLNIHVITDEFEPFNGNVNIQLRSMDGDELEHWKKDISIDANDNKIILSENLVTVLNGQDKKKVYLEMNLVSNKLTIDSGIHYFVKPKDLILNDVFIKTTVQNNTIILKSDGLAKSVCLTSKNAEGFFSDNYFDLLPGVEKTVTFTPKKNGKITEEGLSIITLANIFE